MVTENTQTPVDGADDEAGDIAEFDEAFDNLLDGDENGQEVSSDADEDAEGDQDAEGDDESSDAGDDDADKSKAGDDAGEEDGDKKEGDEGKPETAEAKAERLAHEREQRESAETWWRELKLLHEDAEEVAAADWFRKDWLPKQDDATRKMANGTPAQAAAVLNRAKAEHAAASRDDGTQAGARISDAKAATADAQDLAAFLKANPKLAGQEIEYVDETGDKVKGTLQEFLTEKGYPDVFSAMYQVMRAMQPKQSDEGSLQAAIDKVLSEKGYVTREDVKVITARLADFDVMQAHSDAPQIFASQSFETWRKALPENIGRMKDGTAEEKIALLDLYKQREGGGEAARKKATRDKLHTNTLRKGQRTSSGTRQAAEPETAEEEEAEFDEKFEEMADKLDKGK